MTAGIESLSDLVNLLNRALSKPTERVAAIKTFQNYVFERAMPISGATAEQWQILHDLAFDLDYYEPEPKRRQEDSAFYGDERLAAEIHRALEQLTRLSSST
jgi:hypothetical protein